MFLLQEKVPKKDLEKLEFLLSSLPDTFLEGNVVKEANSYGVEFYKLTSEPFGNKVCRISVWRIESDDANTLYLKIHNPIQYFKAINDNGTCSKSIGSYTQTGPTSLPDDYLLEIISGEPELFEIAWEIETVKNKDNPDFPKQLSYSDFLLYRFDTSSDDKANYSWLNKDLGFEIHLTVYLNRQEKNRFDSYSGFPI